MPLVSVCIPVYDNADYLREAIESALTQTLKDIEIIVADPLGVTDAKAIAESFKDERVRYVKNENHVSMAEDWNFALKQGSGKYLKLLHADDLICEESLQKAAEILEKDEDVSIVISASEVIDSKGRRVMTRRLFDSDIKINGKRYAKRAFRGKNIFGEPTAALFRAEDFERIGGYDSEFPYFVDWDFSARLAYLGDVYYFTEVLFKYRISETSETSNLYRKGMKRMLDDGVALLKKHREYIKLSDFDLLVFRSVSWVRMLARTLFTRLKIKGE